MSNEVFPEGAKYMIGQMIFFDALDANTFCITEQLKAIQEGLAEEPEV